MTPTPTLRGLTLIQPWAWAIAHAGKRVENRSWWPPPALPGAYLAIHAGKTCEAGTIVRLRAAGIDCPGPGSTVRGAIVAVARLAGATDDPADLPEGQRFWWAGPVGWILDDVVALPEPVACIGALGLWRLSTEVEAEVRRQWGAAVRARQDRRAKLAGVLWDRALVWIPDAELRAAVRTAPKDARQRTALAVVEAIEAGGFDLADPEVLDHWAARMAGMIVMEIAETGGGRG